MKVPNVIAFILVLIFIALAWRFLVGVLLLSLPVLMWVLFLNFAAILIGFWDEPQKII